ncbi:hypothetical protein BST61_g7005 [Cercospora zeina]
MAGLQAPALLQVCRQIRNEAARMYFEQTLFQLWIKDCKPGLLYEWVEMARRYIGDSCVDDLLSDGSIDYNTDGADDLDNIIQWCKLVLEGKLPEWDREGDDITYGVASPTVIAGHRLALQMRARPWAEFVAAFEILHSAVKGACEQTLALARYS